MDGQPKKKTWWEQTVEALSRPISTTPQGGAKVTMPSTTKTTTPYIPGGSFTTPTYNPINTTPGADLGGTAESVTGFRDWWNERLGPSGKSTFGALASNTEVPTFNQNENAVVDNQVVTDTDVTDTGVTDTGVTDTVVTGTRDVKTKDLTAQSLYDTEKKLYDELRKYQELTATNASEAQKRALADTIRRTQRDYQNVQNAIMESGFTQDRQLLQASQQRGLGASGLEQLGRTQQRMAMGQNLNQLSQQYGDRLQGFLNTQLGIEQNLSEALSKAALDETINVTTAMAKAMDNEWTAWQRSKTVEDASKFDEKETASIYLEYVTALTNAGDDAALKEQIRTSYRGLLPETLYNQGTNLAGNKSLGTLVRNAQSSATLNTGGDKAAFDRAMAADEGDGKVSMLKTGNATMYFPNDDALLMHVRSIYSSRENSSRIQMYIKNGKVTYRTDQGQEFTTYNEASNSLG
jgi:hypothetical protein